MKSIKNFNEFINESNDAVYYSLKGKKITALELKDEDDINGEIFGPLWAMVDGKWIPYELESEQTKWFSYPDADKIAKKLKIHLLTI